MFGEEIWAFGIDTIVCFFALDSLFSSRFFVSRRAASALEIGLAFYLGMGSGGYEMFFFVLID
jgi:hypothetical protein